MSIEKIYAEARGSWTGADWTHGEYENGEFVECGGTDDCPTCRDAKRDAARAEAAAAEAMALYRAGDLAGALDAAAEAAAIERRWGDDPTWRPLRLALEAEDVA